LKWDANLSGTTKRRTLMEVMKVEKLTSDQVVHIRDQKELQRIARELGLEVKPKEAKNAIVDFLRQREEAEAARMNEESSTESSPQQDEGEAFEEDELSGKEKLEQSEAAQAQAESDRQAEEAVNDIKNKKQRANSTEKAMAAVKVLEFLEENVEADASKAAKIRAALQAGFERAAIAKALEVRYQQVFQVEKQMKNKKNPK